MMSITPKRSIQTRTYWHAAVSLFVFAIHLTLGTAFSVASETKPIHIVAFGDSLTAGYQLPPADAFPVQLERALKARGHNVKISNAGVSGDTTRGGLERFDWAVPQDTDAVILELGANDALRGIAPEVTKQNLTGILKKLDAKKVPVLLAGMRALANWGNEYAQKFNVIYPDLAKAHNAILYPFFMEGVIDKPELKLSDALHPNTKGVELIVQQILPDVEKLIARVKQQRTQ
ncbi:MAG: arylesterase [Pseudomonadota bacterium]